MEVSERDSPRGAQTTLRESGSVSTRDAASFQLEPIEANPRQQSLSKPSKESLVASEAAQDAAAKLSREESEEDGLDFEQIFRGHEKAHSLSRSESEISSRPYGFIRQTV